MLHNFSILSPLCKKIPRSSLSSDKNVHCSMCVLLKSLESEWYNVEKKPLCNLIIAKNLFWAKNPWWLKTDLHLLYTFITIQTSSYYQISILQFHIIYVSLFWIPSGNSIQKRAVSTALFRNKRIVLKLLLCGNVSKVICLL